MCSYCVLTRHVAQRTVKVDILQVSANAELKAVRKVRFEFANSVSLPFIEELTTGISSWEVLLFVPLHNGFITKFTLLQDEKTTTGLGPFNYQTFYVEREKTREGNFEFAAMDRLSSHEEHFLRLAAYSPGSAQIKIFNLPLTSRGTPQLTLRPEAAVDFNSTSLFSKILSTAERPAFLFVRHLHQSEFVTVNTRGEVKILNFATKKEIYSEPINAAAVASVHAFEFKKRIGKEGGRAFALRFPTDNGGDFLYVWHGDVKRPDDKVSGCASRQSGEGRSAHGIASVLLSFDDVTLSCFDFEGEALIYFTLQGKAENKAYRVELNTLDVLAAESVLLVDQEVRHFSATANFLWDNFPQSLVSELFYSNLFAMNLFTTAELAALDPELAKEKDKPSRKDLYQRIKAKVDSMKNSHAVEKGFLLHHIGRDAVSNKLSASQVLGCGAQSNLPGSLVLRSNGQLSLVVAVPANVELANRLLELAVDVNTTSKAGEEEPTSMLAETHEFETIDAPMKLQVVMREGNSPALWPKDEVGRAINALWRAIRSEDGTLSISFADMIAMSLVDSESPVEHSFARKVEDLADFLLGSPHLEDTLAALGLWLLHKEAIIAFLESPFSVAPLRAAEKCHRAELNTSIFPAVTKILSVFVLKTYDTQIACLFLRVLFERLALNAGAMSPEEYEKQMRITIGGRGLWDALKEKVFALQLLKTLLVKERTHTFVVDDWVTDFNFSGSSGQAPLTSLPTTGEAQAFVAALQQQLEAKTGSDTDVPLKALFEYVVENELWAAMELLGAMDWPESPALTALLMVANLRLGKATEFGLHFVRLALALSDMKHDGHKQIKIFLRLNLFVAGELSASPAPVLSVSELTSGVVAAIRRQGARSCLNELVNYVPFIPGIAPATLQRLYLDVVAFSEEDGNVAQLVNSINSLSAAQRSVIAGSLMKQLIEEHRASDFYKEIYLRFPQVTIQAFDAILEQSGARLFKLALEGAKAGEKRLQESRTIVEMFFGVALSVGQQSGCPGLALFFSELCELLTAIDPIGRGALLLGVLELILAICAEASFNGFELFLAKAPSRALKDMCDELGIKCPKEGGVALRSDEFDKIALLVSLQRDGLESRKTKVSLKADELLLHHFCLSDLELCRSLCFYVPRIANKFAFLLVQRAFDKYLTIISLIKRKRDQVQSVQHIH